MAASHRLSRLACLARGHERVPRKPRYGRVTRFAHFSSDSRSLAGSGPVTSLFLAVSVLCATNADYKRLYPLPNAAKLSKLDATCTWPVHGSPLDDASGAWGVFGRGILDSIDGISVSICCPLRQQSLALCPPPVAPTPPYGGRHAPRRFAGDCLQPLFPRVRPGGWDLAAIVRRSVRPWIEPPSLQQS
jgi:hypothetical protein